MSSLGQLWKIKGSDQHKLANWLRYKAKMRLMFWIGLIVI